MLTRENNEFLTRTGPGTPMADLFGRYWIPIMCADELTEPGTSRFKGNGRKADLGTASSVAPPGIVAYAIPVPVECRK